MVKLLLMNKSMNEKEQIKHLCVTGKLYFFLFWKRSNIDRFQVKSKKCKLDFYDNCGLKEDCLYLIKYSIIDRINKKKN